MIKGFGQRCRLAKELVMRGIGDYPVEKLGCSAMSAGSGVYVI
jgi:hypothetical protein